ncbi:MAG: UPF0149 family protein [Hyphomicrobium sp.]
MKDVDLAFLDRWLVSDEAPEHCMPLSDLDGFLAAVAIGPEPILPSEWITRIWNGGEPAFKSTKKAQRVLGIIMARYNEILFDVAQAPEDYQPLFWERPQYGPVTGDWCEGFLDGVVLRRAAWEPFLTSAAGTKLMAPIYAGTDPKAIMDALGFEVTSSPEMIEKSAEAIPGAVVEIARRYAQFRR